MGKSICHLENMLSKDMKFNDYELTLVCDFDVIMGQWIARYMFNNWEIKVNFSTHKAKLFL